MRGRFAPTWGSDIMTILGTAALVDALCELLPVRLALFLETKVSYSGFFADMTSGETIPGLNPAVDVTSTKGYVSSLLRSIRSGILTIDKDERSSDVLAMVVTRTAVDSVVSASPTVDRDTSDSVALVDDGPISGADANAMDIVDSVGVAECGDWVDEAAIEDEEPITGAYGVAI